jgi:hypothetical protein
MLPTAEALCQSKKPPAIAGRWHGALRLSPILICRDSWQPGSLSSCCDSLIHFVAMSISRKFAHDDIVRVMETGETGIIKSFHQDENGFVYGVQLGRGAATETGVPEDELELVKIANDDETGFAVRYIS